MIHRVRPCTAHPAHHPNPSFLVSGVVQAQNLTSNFKLMSRCTFVVFRSRIVEAPPGPVWSPSSARIPESSISRLVHVIFFCDADSGAAMAFSIQLSSTFLNSPGLLPSKPFFIYFKSPAGHIPRWCQSDDFSPIPCACFGPCLRSSFCPRSPTLHSTHLRCPMPGNISISILLFRLMRHRFHV